MPPLILFSLTTTAAKKPSIKCFKYSLQIQTEKDVSAYLALHYVRMELPFCKKNQASNSFGKNAKK